VAHWSDAEVARRWLLLFPKRVNADGSPAEPLRAEIDQLVNNPDELSKRRRRLSDISWWARCTAENIARQSNREDNVTGHFWNRPMSCVTPLRLTKLDQEAFFAFAV
jgi:hypothetical protein